jgi:uncharacterized RDD family membrane protein YckC
LRLRLAAMIYEAVLLFGVVFAAGFALLIATGWTYPLSPPRRLVLQAVVFVAVGVYFVVCWTGSGQTLALKTWKLRIEGPGGTRLKIGRAIARYVLAWHLFVPGAVFIALFPAHGAVDLFALASGFALLLIPACLDPAHRLLHDRWTGSQVVRQTVNRPAVKDPPRPRTAAR